MDEKNAWFLMIPRLLISDLLQKMVKLADVEAVQALFTSNPTQAIQKYNQFLKDCAGIAENPPTNPPPLLLHGKVKQKKTRKS